MRIEGTRVVITGASSLSDGSAVEVLGDASGDAEDVADETETDAATEASIHRIDGGEHVVAS